MEGEEKSCHGEDDRIGWLALKLIPGLGNRSLLRLVRHFGSPGGVLKAGAEELSRVPGLHGRARDALLRKEFLRSPETEWEVLRREGVEMICLNDPDYPSNLASIPDPPAALFLKGGIEPRDLVSIAVVGSRAASTHGILFTERLCMDLVRSGVTIVSGFAVGIDGAAHRGALKANGRTLAVLGCGVDVGYPRANADLRDRIAQSGALISEFPLATPPAPGHFPMRNRIISGLALGVVVVEAAQKSGSLITARLALEQGREVFAVPGMALHFRSVGSHRLLKQGAKLVESAEDVLDEIQPLVRPSWEAGPRGAHTDPGPCISPEEKTLYEVLDETPQHIDAICRSVRWPVARAASVLLSLELKGYIQQLPGKYFLRPPHRTG